MTQCRPLKGNPSHSLRAAMGPVFEFNIQTRMVSLTQRKLSSPCPQCWQLWTELAPKGAIPSRKVQHRQAVGFQIQGAGMGPYPLVEGLI